MRSTNRLMIMISLAVIGTAGCTKAKVQMKPNLPITTVEVEPPKLTPEQQADLEAILAKAILHFDYDEAALTSASRARLDDIADALRVRPWASIRIAGHCDERGTEEYNLALGQRRAAIARKYLIASGVDPSAVETVSYGSEVPAVVGHDEDAWAWNRRDELVPKDSEAIGMVGSSGEQ
jgi:peptidoglycan-associated lipoprotein